MKSTADLAAEQAAFWNGPGGQGWLAAYHRIQRSLVDINRAVLAHAFDLHPEAAVRFEIDNVSITMIEHFEQANPQHAWRVSFVNYMPRELTFARGGPA